MVETQQGYLLKKNVSVCSFNILPENVRLSYLRVLKKLYKWQIIYVMNTYSMKYLQTWGFFCEVDKIRLD